MKKSAIKEIFNGERGTLETVVFGEKHEECFGRLVEKDEGMRKILAGQTELLKKYEETVDLIEEKNRYAAEDFFAEGFILGLRIGIEAGERS